MPCPDCKGTGKIGSGYYLVALFTNLPCRGCGGSGKASCCEGAVGGADEVTNLGFVPLAEEPHTTAH